MSAGRGIRTGTDRSMPSASLARRGRNPAARAPKRRFVVSLASSELDVHSLRLTWPGLGLTVADLRLQVRVNARGEMGLPKACEVLLGCCHHFGVFGD